MKFKQIYTPNQSDKEATEMKYPNMYKDKSAGASDKVRKEKVVIRNSKTGQVYGMRTVVQKRTS